MGRIPLLVGPTAVGKTAVSIWLAQKLDAEIVSVDSRQIYRELTIGSAKPSIDERAGIKHHFVDELSLPDVVSAGRFERDANARISDALDRGKRIIVVGGSTLYIHALLNGLPDIPAVDHQIVVELNEAFAAGQSAALYRELKSVDPVFAATLDETKSQRIVRGLSVFRGTGKPLSSFFASAIPGFAYQMIKLSRPRDELYNRIDARVIEMIGAGLLDEARTILDAGHSRELSPLRTIGYRESFEFIDGTIDSLDEMTTLMQRNTRRYAKRQLTWLRRYSDAIEFDATVPCEDLGSRILLLCDG